MHIGTDFAAPPSSYPSPPSLTPTRDGSLSHSPNIMGGSGVVNADGIGELNYQRALDLARQSEGELDQTVKEYLEAAIRVIWQKVARQPDTYVLTNDEFAVFNFYQARFRGNELAQRAIARYWRVARRQEGS